LTSRQLRNGPARKVRRTRGWVGDRRSTQRMARSLIATPRLRREVTVAVLLYLPLANELDQDRLGAARGDRMKHCRDVRISNRKYLRDGGAVVADGVEDLLFALGSVLEIIGELRRAVGDNRTVRGIEGPHFKGPQAA